jgi:NADP-dependent 3-hydroxy acid dehydrogenase YdfG
MTDQSERPVAVVTGASSGIGAATARRLGEQGWSVVLGARRADRLEEATAAAGPHARGLALDVTDPASVQAFCDAVPECRLLVNNAGGALGLAPVSAADEDQWRTMYDTNVLGAMRMVRALLDKLVASGDGHVISIGSIAAIETYAGGAGYNAAKYANRAVMDVLRLELLGRPVRVSEIDPGMVETEFSLVRFDGDADRAEKVYEGLTPLTADDVAETVVFVASRPSHVDIDQLVIRPRDQARSWAVNREG